MGEELREGREVDHRDLGVERIGQEDLGKGLHEIAAAFRGFDIRYRRHPTRSRRTGGWKAVDSGQEKRPGIAARPSR